MINQLSELSLMHPRKVLIIGGAGYIGSHMVKALLRAGLEVVVLDNLVTGHRDAILGGEFVHGDIGDRKVLDQIFQRHCIDAVMNFSGYIQVGESIVNPSPYYLNNLAKTVTLLDAMVAHNVLALVFSSTAAIFGEPCYLPIDENHPKAPLSPYGNTKLMVEIMLADFDRAYGLKNACLRYFNAAGADPEGDLGERHEPETHLIPIALEAALGQRDSLSIYGDDYDTPDGTCIRDYVHVTDLCDAHLRALQYLWAEKSSLSLNLGNGAGFSVREVIDTVEMVTGTKLVVHNVPRRLGDPARLVASTCEARERLGWIPSHSDLTQIVSDAWQWKKAAFPS